MLLLAPCASSCGSVGRPQGAGRARGDGRGLTAPSCLRLSLASAVRWGQECCRGDGGLSTCLGHTLLSWEPLCSPCGAHQSHSCGTDVSGCGYPASLVTTCVPQVPAASCSCTTQIFVLSSSNNLNESWVLLYWGCCNPQGTLTPCRSSVCIDGETLRCLSHK